LENGEDAQRAGRARAALSVRLRLLLVLQVSLSLLVIVFITSIAITVIHLYFPSSILDHIQGAMATTAGGIFTRVIS
jgi:hypothetical protein